MAFTTSSLTKGSIAQIVNMQSSNENKSFQPIVQILSLKNVGPGTNKEGADRFRVVLSDGDYFVQGMLATQLKPFVDSGELQQNSIVRVPDFINNSIQGRNIIIILSVDVLGMAPQRLGQPMDYQKAGSTMGNHTGAPPTAQPMYNRTNIAQQQQQQRQPQQPQAMVGVTTSSSSNKPNPYSSASPNAKYSPNSVLSNAPIVHRGSGSTPGGTPITPISQLNMYQNRWTIKARVVSKSDIRTWSNAKGEGSLFSMELLDGSGMDIRATMFKEAVDKFYNFLQVGSVYTISGGRIKVANMQYNTCKSQYEMTLDQNSEIKLADDEGDIQAVSFDLVKIGNLEQIEQGKNVDVMGIVQEITDVQSLTSKKTGQELQKADVMLIDDTGVQVRLTLWGSQAVDAHREMPLHKVVAFRRVRVSDYGGKSLSGAQSYFVEPNIPETEDLQVWWKSQGSRGAPIKSLSSSGGAGGKMDPFAERKQIGDIKGLHLGYENEKGDYLSFKATFTFFKKDKEGGAWYTACPNKDEPCRNRCKVTQTTDGNWQCDRCQGTYPTCTRKWIFSGVVADDTSSTWVSLFDDQALTLFNGTTADEVFEKYEDQDTYDGYFEKANHTEWILKCRVKNEMVNDEPRLKTTVVRMDPVDYLAESTAMLSVIEKWL